MRGSMDETFLCEIRAFLSAALTEDLRAAGRHTVGVHSDVSACRIWHRRLFERGWIAPAWPVSHGGTGWTAVQRLVFDRECAAHDAPVLIAGGLRSLGPLLMAIGSRVQRERYLPAILDGSDLWCQGFSETCAGSDLAALKTRARRDGAFYVVDGAKIWTTGAHIANRMFCLVRTENSSKPQEGITFLLIDMTLPGISVRPILTLSGEAEFNEVFFDGVRVPVDDRVGAENAGWDVAKTLMRVARSNNTTSGQLRRAMRKARMVMEAQLPLDHSAVQLAALAVELDAFEAMEVAVLTIAGTRGMTDVEASMLKVTATELHQRIAALILDAEGSAAAEAHPSSFASAKYFATRAASIYSGTNETHRNLIARHGLGV